MYIKIADKCFCNDPKEIRNYYFEIAKIPRIFFIKMIIKTFEKLCNFTLRSTCEYISPNKLNVI